MTEGELARFFGVTWKKLNHRLQMIQKSSNLHPDEMCADERAMSRGKESVGYTPLYPLSTIIALSCLLDSTETHLFRRDICHKIQQQRTSITPIFLFGGAHHWFVHILFLSLRLSYYMTTIRSKTVKEKRLWDSYYTINHLTTNLLPIIVKAKLFVNFGKHLKYFSIRQDTYY